jgi:hypothetical protein
VFSFVFYRHQKLRSAFTLVVGFGLLLAISALKSTSVGNDTDAYFIAYNRIAEQNWNSLNFGNFKIGFLLLNKIFSSLGVPFNGFLVFVYLLMYVPIAYVFYKRSPNVELSILLFIFWSFLCFDLSGLRQGISISLCMLVFEFLVESNETSSEHKKTFLIVASVSILLLSFSIHPSSLIFGIVYLLYFIQFRIRYLSIIVPLFFISFSICGPLFQFIYSVVGNIDYSPGSYGGGGVFFSYVFLLLFIIFFSEFKIVGTVNEKALSLDAKMANFTKFFRGQPTPIDYGFFNCVIWFLILGTFFQSFSPVNPVFPRFGFYFISFATIAIPMAIEAQESKSLRIIISTLFAVSFGLYFYFYYLRVGALGMTPYKFFWQ